MKNLIRELPSLSWTLAGVSAVLITLGEEARKWGIIISLVALFVLFIGTVANLGHSEE
jgi:hypothetical protein